MKLCELTIKPSSGFGTPLKGDTIFGHLCWQAAYDRTLLNGGLEQWIGCYAERPFFVCSSAWAKFCDTDNKTFYALKRPDLPLSVLFPALTNDKKTALRERKNNQKKKWLIADDTLVLNLDKTTYKSDKDLIDIAVGQATEETKRIMRRQQPSEFLREHDRQHNTINRLTMTTGEGMFAPFSEMGSYYFPETELAVFVLYDEDATDSERMCKAFERIGQFGFGKDASTGWGRFELGECEEIKLPDVASANACYALSPVVPEVGVSHNYYFTPFVRYGRHGDVLARSQNPFKCPILMADEGAVFFPKGKDVFEKPYVGRAVLNFSKAMERSVHQGYAMYLPMKLEMTHE